ncbi:Hypothetical_protein [Hexamita inflata]|uniref:Hypothetical_protein n=1 Tax=Hexamita inflata TaxID=28002 RepID=A0AA86QCP7_9EUKA|nr:Hypothetical protein HINF_LOCUS38347 [Hexamita inflata]
MELKQLSQLNAEFNKNIDTESIQLHPNFNNFDLDDQKQPTKEELQTANILRDINSPISSLKQICKESSRIKIKTSLSDKKQLNSYNSHIAVMYNLLLELPYSSKIQMCLMVVSDKSINLLQLLIIHKVHLQVVGIYGNMYVNKQYNRIYNV